MMAIEYLYCILEINPDARCTVWGEDGESLRVKWDESHEGAKPTIEDCQAVLPLVRDNLALRQKAVADAALIQSEMEAIAIASLKKRGAI